MSSFDFQVDKNTLSKHQLLECKSPVLAVGEVRLLIERFALTANNITYGVMGAELGYWDFFPAKDNWGRIPVWGIGMVVESNCESIVIGNRFYGYYPMSSELVVQPENISAKGFKDASLHRNDLSTSYNQYSLMTTKICFLPNGDNYHILYRPLFLTGLLLEDYLKTNEYFGASKLLISSASSKTAISLAFMLGKLGHSKLTGLTSQKNLSFVESLDLYDEVISYDQIELIQTKHHIVYVDICGDSMLLQKVQHHFNNKLSHCCKVGMTHSNIDTTLGKEKSKTRTFPTVPRTSLKNNHSLSYQSQFFAPNHIAKCYQSLGSVGFNQYFEQSWAAFVAQIDKWIEISEFSAKENLANIYTSLLKGTSPSSGIVITNDYENI